MRTQKMDTTQFSINYCPFIKGNKVKKVNYNTQLCQCNVTLSQLVTKSLVAIICTDNLSNQCDALLLERDKYQAKLLIRKNTENTPI